MLTCETRKQYSLPSIGPVAATLYKPGRSLSDLNVTIDFSLVPVDEPRAPNSPMIVSRLVLVTESLTSAN